MDNFPTISCHDIIFNGQISYYRHPADEPFSPDTAFVISEDWASVDEISVAFTKLVKKEERLAKKHKFAWDPEFGFLTPRLAWCGNGLTLSCDIHLEGLHLLGRLNQTLEALNALRISYNSNSYRNITHAGHMFTLENSSSLGISDRDLCRRISSVFDDLLRQEMNAREKLIKEKSIFFDDSIERAIAILQNARIISQYEVLDMVSPIALAASFGFINGATSDHLYELMFTVMDDIENKIDDDEYDLIADQLLAEHMRNAFRTVKLNTKGKKYLR